MERSILDPGSIPGISTRAMIDKNYRSAKGRQLDGRALAVRISQEVIGMMLAHAYMLVKSAGLHLRINKFDGVPRPAGSDDAVNVDVVDGYIKKSWVTPAE